MLTPLFMNASVIILVNDINGDERWSIYSEGLLSFGIHCKSDM